MRNAKADPFTRRQCRPTMVTKVLWGGPAALLLLTFFQKIEAVKGKVLSMSTLSAAASLLTVHKVT